MNPFLKIFLYLLIRVSICFIFVCFLLIMGYEPKELFWLISDFLMLYIIGEFIYVSTRIILKTIKINEGKKHQQLVDSLKIKTTVKNENAEEIISHLGYNDRVALEQKKNKALTYNEKFALEQKKNP